MTWVKQRIDTAMLVITDLTDSNPNVYLEVGYAWGRNVATILIVKDDLSLKFDVRGHRCIVYKTIKQLEQSLMRELRGLQLTN